MLASHDYVHIREAVVRFDRPLLLFRHRCVCVLTVRNEG